MNASDFFSPEDKKLIEKAILEAEHNTSGEIRVHVETSFKGDILDRAATVFALLNMHKTKIRNGVLIYLAIKNRQFAILGDAGINQVVPDNFWNTTKSAMENHFRNSEFALGLISGITMAGEQMKKHFPHQQDDINELSNEMTFDAHEK
jgi:uncharacterized membrane protein